MKILATGLTVLSIVIIAFPAFCMEQKEKKPCEQKMNYSLYQADEETVDLSIGVSKRPKTVIQDDPTENEDEMTLDENNLAQEQPQQKKAQKSSALNRKFHFIHHVPLGSNPIEFIHHEPIKPRNQVSYTHLPLGKKRALNSINPPAELTQIGSSGKSVIAPLITEQLDPQPPHTTLNQPLEKTIADIDEALQKDFFKACESGATEEIKKFASLNVSKNRKDPEKQMTPLEATIKRDDVTVFEILHLSFKESSDLGAFAITDNKKNCCLDFLVKDAIKSKYQDVLLYNAAKLGLHTCLEQLINHGVDPNAPIPSENDSALICAASSGHITCVNLLLKKGALASMDALKAAKNLEIAALINAALDVQLPDKDKTIKALLEGRALPSTFSINKQDTEGKTILMKLLAENVTAPQIKAVGSLLETNNPLLHQIDKKGNTALMYAILSKNKALVELVIDSKGLHTDGKNALLLAAKNGLITIVDYLLIKLGGQNAQTELIKQAFYQAIASNQYHLVLHILLKWRPILQQRAPACPLNRLFLFSNKPFPSPTQYAAAKGSPDALNILITNGFPTQSEEDPITTQDAYIAALLAGKFQIAVSLLRTDRPNEASIERLIQAISYCSPPLLEASKELLMGKSISQVSRKLDYKESLCLVDTLRGMQKYFLINPKHYFNELIKQYRAFKDNPAYGNIAHEQESVKRMATWEKHYEKFATQFTFFFKNQQTPLMWACIFGYKDIVEKFLTIGLPRKYINEKDSFGRTALMYALLYGNVDCALLLIQHERKDATGQKQHTNHCGKGINLVDNQGRTALFYAVYAARTDGPVPIKIGEHFKTSLIAHSQQMGAMKIIDVLHTLGAKFGSIKNATDACTILSEDGNWEVLIHLLMRITQISNRLGPENTTLWP